jgi:hypothetical protein
MNGHIMDAKKKLNFSIFSSYKIGKQYKSFDDINKEVKDGDMPIGSYTLIHRDAVLSQSQKLAIANCVQLQEKKLKQSIPLTALNIIKLLNQCNHHIPI